MLEITFTEWLASPEGKSAQGNREEFGKACWDAAFRAGVSKERVDAANVAYAAGKNHGNRMGGHIGEYCAQAIRSRPLP